MAILFTACQYLKPVVKISSFEFTGAAVGLRSTESKQFTATVSVDGWIKWTTN